MASNYYESPISGADKVGTQVTQCPLCHVSFTGSSDELQLHYLTACPNYVKHGTKSLFYIASYFNGCFMYSISECGASIQIP